MTTNPIHPTEDARPDVKSDLESRIKQRRAELIDKLGELRDDRRAGTGETRDKLKATLSELAHIVKWGVVDGWAAVSDTIAENLENWLTESKRRFAPVREQP